MKHRIIKTVSIWTLLTAVFCAIVVVLAGRLMAQERDVFQQWIHKNRPDCCDHRDCSPATVVMTPTGWQVGGTDNVVPFAQVIRWPFNVPYACIAGRRARCLLMDVRM